MSDVPIGFFLSGGIDSSLSTVLATEVAGQRVKTFTLTYGNQSTTAGKNEDERWARWIADKWQTEHHEERIEFSSFPENFRRILRSFDEPFSGTISTFFLSALIARHVKVAVSGDGADELFGSYLSHRLAFPVAHYPRYAETGDARLIRPFELQPDYVAQFATEPDWQWRSRLLVFSEAEKRALYSRDVMRSLNGTSTAESFRPLFAALTARDPLNRMLEAEYRTIFPDQVLAFVDRLSMAHSLEVRSAYLDTEFVEFVATLPGRLKIRDGETKYILKRAALRYFPEEMVFRRKEGFVMPIAEWLRTDLKGYVVETLGADRLRLHGLFDPARVASLIERMTLPDSTYMDANRVFSLLAFQEWFEQYMVRKPVPAETFAC
jgi:asparagine synthase (glutamine-hydrolysing)